MLPESRERVTSRALFLQRQRRAREACQGDGLKRIEMNFLPDVYVTCEVCRGARYNRETLDVRYQGKNIAQLSRYHRRKAWSCSKTSADQRNYRRSAKSVWATSSSANRRRRFGGEAQRIKLAKELSRRATGRTVYILDEPTTGCI